MRRALAIALVPLGIATSARAQEPLQVDRQPVPISGSCRTPAYPDSLRQANIEGRVLLGFVIDTAGRVELGSVRVLSSTHRAFEAPARAAVLTCRYEPGRVGGRPVRARVGQPVDFSVLPAQAPESASCPAGRATLRPVPGHFRSRRPAEAVGAAVPRVLRDLGYQLDAGRSEAGHWRTRPAYEWPPGSDDERGQLGTHPGVWVDAIVTTSGDSTTVNFTGGLVCAATAAEQDARNGPADRLQRRAVLRILLAMDRELRGRPD